MDELMSRKCGRVLFPNTEPKLDIMIPSKLLGPDGRQTGIVKQYWTMEKYAGGTRWGPIVN